MIDHILRLDLRYHLLLCLVVALGHYQRHHGGRGKCVLDHIVRDLHVVELGRGDRVISVRVGAVARQHAADEDHRERGQRHQLSRRVGVLAYERHLGDKYPMVRLVHQRSEEHEQTRHDEENRAQREEYRLDQADSHIRAYLELHEQHGDETADGRQARRSYLRDALGERLYDRLAQLMSLSFLLIPVDEDDGIVQRQRQLEYARDRVRDK